VGEVLPVGFFGDDGEGYELHRALASLPGVTLDHVLQTAERRTFTYCKPLIVEEGKPPLEVNRLDSKNWTRTPDSVQERLAASVRELGASVDAMIVMDQVDSAETGVVTECIRSSVQEALATNPRLIVLADSRRGLADFPPLVFKMNAAELAVLAGTSSADSLEATKDHASALAKRNRQPVFVTLAERGIIGATPDGIAEHVNAFPVRGPIDIVGAGDSVTASLATALAAGANLHEAMLLAMAAASVVIHQLGTTGTASTEQVSDLLC